MTKTEFFEKCDAVADSVCNENKKQGATVGSLNVANVLNQIFFDVKKLQSAVYYGQEEMVSEENEKKLADYAQLLNKWTVAIDAMIELL